MTSQGSDCPEVKRVTAEFGASLGDKVPGTDTKFTAQTRVEYLIRQRTENQEIKAAIMKQNQVAFELENLDIQKEMARRRLDSLRAVLELKRTQISFLGF